MTHPRIVHEAKEYAGTFYDKDRSDAFRRIWPSQDEYVSHKWPHFVAAVKQVWATMLGDPKVPQNIKDYCYDAIIADASGASSPNALDVVQLAPGTQAFQGDKFENRETVKNVLNGDDGHKALVTTGRKFKL